MKPSNEWIRGLLIEINHKCKSADGFSTREFAEVASISMAKAAEKLRLAFYAGLIEFAGKRDVQAIDGTSRKIPVYKLKVSKK